MNEKTEKIKKIRNLLLAGGCVITAIICRHLPTNRESGWVAFFQLTRAYLYITLYCVWGISLQRRIVNKTARRCLCGIASLMVFWFVIRTLKYNVFYEPVLRRYSWYGYYVPLLAIPSLSVIAALKMRESENQKRRQWTGIFLVITEEPFCQITQEHLREAIQVMENCKKVICADVPIGECNKGLEELIRAAKKRM